MNEVLGKKFEGPFEIGSRELPEENGVYILVKGGSPEFEPLYIGRSVNLKRRIRDHIQRSNLSEHIANGEIDTVYFCRFDKDDKEEPDEFERKLIELFGPRFNIRHGFRTVDTQLLQKMIRLEKHSARRSALSVAIFALFISVIALSLAAYLSNNKFTSKVDLQNNITAALENDADLRAIKHIYLNRPEEEPGIFQSFKREADIYSFNVPLSTVLEDIRTNMFLKDGGKALLQKVDFVIEQHTQINPFDRLEPIQRDYFENIRIKLDENYSSVIIEVNKIADELHNKNTLVDRYLKDSNTSFWVSIIALMFSVLVSSYQIFNGRGVRMQRLIAESLSKVVNDEDTNNT